MHWNSSNISLEKADFQDAIFLGSFVLISYHESAPQHMGASYIEFPPHHTHLEHLQNGLVCIVWTREGEPRSQGKVFHGHSIFLLLLFLVPLTSSENPSYG